MLASITAQKLINHMHTLLREAFTALACTCGRKKYINKRTLMGISLRVQSDTDSCGGCPDEKETNHSELDNTSDRTVMVVIIFTLEMPVLGSIYIEGCVS